MRKVRCPECGERVRMDRLAKHRKSLHRSKKRSMRVPAVAAAAIIAVVIIALALLAFQPKPKDNDDNAPPPADPMAVQVSFRTVDGFELKGTFYRGSPSEPLVIFVHGLGETRGSWGQILTEMRQKGYSVLAFDSRGHGESIVQNGIQRDWMSFSQDEFPMMTKDLVAALHFAHASFAFAPRVAIVGASMGANEALDFAASPNGSEVRSLILLSPGTDFRGLQSGPPAQVLSDRGGVGLFIAVSGADSNSYACGKSLNESYQGKKRLLLQEGGAHGTVMLTYDGIRAEIGDFLKQTL